MRKDRQPDNLVRSARAWDDPGGVAARLSCTDHARNLDQRMVIQSIRIYRQLREFLQRRECVDLPAEGVPVYDSPVGIQQGAGELADY